MVAHAKRSRREPGIAQRLKQQTVEVTELVRDGARAVKDQAVETATELASTVTAEVRQRADERKAKVASTLRRVGKTARRGAELLQPGTAAPIAPYVELAADSIDRASKYLEDNPPAQMIQDLGELARRHPAVTLGGVLLVGLAAGRLARLGLDEERNRERRRERHERAERDQRQDRRNRRRKR